MKGFWTCGPFKEMEDRRENMAYRMEQMEIFLKVIEEDKNNQEIIASGSFDEKMIASLIQLDIDKRMAILLGVPDGNEKTNDEISRETLLELIRKRPEN